MLSYFLGYQTIFSEFIKTQLQQIFVPFIHEKKNQYNFAIPQQKKSSAPSKIISLENI